MLGQVGQMTERFGKGQPRQGFCESFRKFPDGAVGALRNQDWVYALRLPVPRAHTAKGEAFLSTLIFLKQPFVLHSRRSQAPRFVLSEDCFCERRQKTFTGSGASKYQTSSPGLINPRFRIWRRNALNSKLFRRVSPTASQSICRE